MNTEAIKNALKEVIDPDFKKDIVSLGMVKAIEPKDNILKIELELTTPACPLKSVFENNIREVLTKHNLLPEGTELVVEFSSNISKWSGGKTDLLPQVNYVIAVASGKGGVGKSTVAANIAVSLAQEGAQVGLLDADIYGPSIPKIFGVEGYTPEITKYKGVDFIVPVFKYHVHLMSIGFLIPPEKALAWRGPMASNALQQMIRDTLWPELDYLVVDLPPGTGDIQMTIAQILNLNGAVIVTTPQQLATIDAARAIDMFQIPSVNIPVLGVVENMSYFTPPELPDKKYYIFGKGGGEELAKKYNIPLLGQIPITEDVTTESEMGIPIAIDVDNPQAKAFKQISNNIIRELAKNIKVTV